MGDLAEKIWTNIIDFMKDQWELVMENKMTRILTLVGGGIIFWKYLKLQNAIYRYFLRPSKDLKKIYGGQYAVITGGSIGIGRAYAFQLAKRGYNLVRYGEDLRIRIPREHPKRIPKRKYRQLHIMTLLLLPRLPRMLLRFSSEGKK